MRNKIPDLTMACAGRFADHHALLARMHTDHIDHLTHLQLNPPGESGDSTLLETMLPHRY